MSNYRGNHDRCPHGCGLKYKGFKTGLRYYDIFVMLMDYSKDSSEWKYKRRSTILGKWHEIKKQMWQHHVDEACLKDPRNAALIDPYANTSHEEVPF